MGRTDWVIGETGPSKRSRSHTSHFPVCLNLCNALALSLMAIWNLQDIMEIKPTIPGVKFVAGMVFTSKWFANQFIDVLTGFISAEMDLEHSPLKSIEISEWIQRLKKLELGIDTSSWQGLRGLYQIAEFLRRMDDPSFSNPLLSQAELIGLPQALDGIKKNLESSEFGEVNRLCNAVLKNAGAKGTFDVVALLAITRAAQTAYRCIARYRVSPMVLIEQSRSGERQAVLDLVKIDKLFLFDSCTQSVLQRGLLSGNMYFNGQLARAQGFKPQFGRRAACELYLYMLLGHRMELPSISKLRTLIDPDGTTFPRTYDFEKCYERRKREVSETSEHTRTRL